MAGIRFPEDEAYRRKTRICEDGQPVRPKVEVLDGSLVAIVLESLPGFTHLVQDPEECIASYGPYHISIAQIELFTAQMIADLRSRWDDVEVVLPIDIVRADGYMELGDCPLYRDATIQALHGHPDAWYRERSLHISG